MFVTLHYTKVLIHHYTILATYKIGSFKSWLTNILGPPNLNAIKLEVKSKQDGRQSGKSSCSDFGPILSFSKFVT